MPTPITWTPHTVSASTVSASTQKKIGPLEAGTKASRVFTFASAGLDGETYTITGPLGGAIVYTEKNTVDNAVPYQFTKGASATLSAVNLKNCILGTGTGFSTSTPANKDVTAANTAGALTVTATFGGTAGNSITVATTSADGTWAGPNLTGGANPDIVIPASSKSFTVCNPSVKSFVGSIVAPPAEVIYISTDSTDVDSGFPVTAITPRKIEFQPNFPPTWYVNTPETGAIPFSVVHEF